MTMPHVAFVHSGFGGHLPRCTWSALLGIGVLFQPVHARLARPALRLSSLVHVRARPANRALVAATLGVVAGGAQLARQARGSRALLAVATRIAGEAADSAFVADEACLARSALFEARGA